MKDAMVMVYFWWLFYGVALVALPETFKPLLWVAGILSIFFVLLGMFTESARSAQEYRLLELAHKHMMERKMFDHQAAMQQPPTNDMNGSYFLHGLGAKK